MTKTGILNLLLGPTRGFLTTKRRFKMPELRVAGAVWGSDSDRCEGGGPSMLGNCLELL